jgi:hypothetical protein
VQAIAVEPFADPLRAVRDVLDGADEALLGVAFVQHRGVNLLGPQLKTVGTARLVTTTVFGSTTADGLMAARDLGLGGRVFNPARGTFHPKLYLARRGGEVAVAVGSANLTSGLVANVEVGAVLRGSADAPQLRKLWKLAESWWDHLDAVAWAPDRVVAPREVLEPALFRRVRGAVEPGQLVHTLGMAARPNWIREVTPDAVWVETSASRAKGTAPRHVEAWMIQIAWDWLDAHGRLTAKYLQANDVKGAISGVAPSGPGWRIGAMPSRCSTFAFRTLLRALVRSRRGLEAKDLELVAPRPGGFESSQQSPRLIRCRVPRGAICTRQDRGVIQGCKPIDRSRLGWA